MFDLMYAREGVGLAAPQVNLPFRLFVINPSADPTRRDLEQVFINPVLSHRKGSVESEEGCLSVPDVYAPVRRPESVAVVGYDQSGRENRFTVHGLLARILQHEFDHLEGILFIDHLSPTAKMSVKDKLTEFEVDFESRRRQSLIPSDEAILARTLELEARYT
jgi:peptide deformylase